MIEIDPDRVDLDLAPAVEAGLHAQVEHQSAASDSSSTSPARLLAWERYTQRR
jgi:hypothetical protein